MQQKPLDELHASIMLLTSLISSLADLSKPSEEQLALQMELRRLQNARRLDEEEFENQKQVLQAQLQTEVSGIAERGKRCSQLFFRAVVSVLRNCLDCRGLSVAVWAPRHIRALYVQSLACCMMSRCFTVFYRCSIVLRSRPS